MARKPRIVSKTGIYHVILRGNNKQAIFEDEEDRDFFLSLLSKYSKQLKFNVYSYCLMDNHVHMVIHENNYSISAIIKRIAGSYAIWFNRKYERVGHLFQDRFKSEPINSKRYFLKVIRYIHNNPVKAGMVTDCSKYKYSSYTEYMRKPRIINSHLCFSLIDKSYFHKFHKKNNSDHCLENIYKTYKFMTDKKAIEFIKSVVPNGIINYLQTINKNKRNEFIRLFRARGMSINQISRLTGISKYIVSKQPLEYC